MLFNIDFMCYCMKTKNKKFSKKVDDPLNIGLDFFTR